MRRSGHPGKRGAITGPPPAALARIGYTPERWRRQVLAVGSDVSGNLPAFLTIKKFRDTHQIARRIRSPRQEPSQLQALESSIRMMDG